MKNSFELVGGSGKNYGYAYSVNRLKDRFLQSNEDKGTVIVRFVDVPPFNVTKETTNAEWNEFSNRYSVNLQND